MTDRELMQQALEALESAKYGMAECRQEIGFDFANEQYDVEQAITALRDRLAQPQSCLKSAVCERGADGYCARCHERMYP
jgi:hypothetical protein